MRAHLENVHPNEHAMMSGTPTKQPRLDSYFYISPQALHLQHDKRRARRNLLHSYART